MNSKKKRHYNPISGLGQSLCKCVYAVGHIGPWTYHWCRRINSYNEKKKKLTSTQKTKGETKAFESWNRGNNCTKKKKKKIRTHIVILSIVLYRSKFSMLSNSYINILKTKEKGSLRTWRSLGGHSTWLVAFTMAMSKSYQQRKPIAINV